MQEFSSSCARIFIKLWENTNSSKDTRKTWDFMKDHSSWEGWTKMKIHQKQNSIKLRKRKSKIHFIKKSVFSQVKKNESAIERIRGYQGEMKIHPRKMEVCQIERNKKCSWVKANKIPKKKKFKKKNWLGWKQERDV